MLKKVVVAVLITVICSVSIIGCKRQEEVESKKEKKPTPTLEACEFLSEWDSSLFEVFGFAGLELIESNAFETGIYSIGMDVEDINEEIEKLEEKGANIALKPIETQVGYMARVVDPNGINIVLVQHTR